MLINAYSVQSMEKTKTRSFYLESQNCYALHMENTWGEIIEKDFGNIVGEIQQRKEHRE